MHTEPEFILMGFYSMGIVQCTDRNTWADRSNICKTFCVGDSHELNHDFLWKKAYFWFLVLFNDTNMDTETQIEELDRQAVHNQSATSSHSDDDQLGANNNPAPTEHTANRSRNGTADWSRIVAVNSSLPVRPVATNPTKEADVEEPNPKKVMLCIKQWLINHLYRRALVMKMMNKTWSFQCHCKLINDKNSCRNVWKVLYKNILEYKVKFK